MIKGPCAENFSAAQGGNGCTVTGEIGFSPKITYLPYLAFLIVILL